MYYTRQLRGLWYVFHSESGTSLPYRASGIKSKAILPSWKEEYFTEWVSLSRRQRLTIRERDNKMNKCSPMDCSKEMIMFAPNMPCTKVNGHTLQYREEEEKKGNTMFREESNETSKKNHLIRRLEDVYYHKSIDMRKVFNMDPADPRSPKELAERLKAGKYTVLKPEDDMSHGNIWDFYWRDYFTWEDPANPADKKGHEAAQNKMDAAYRSAKDTIVVMDEATGLAALREFEAATFN